MDFSVAAGKRNLHAERNFGELPKLESDQIHPEHNSETKTEKTSQTFPKNHAPDACIFPEHIW